MKRIYNKSNLVKGNTYHLEEKYYIHLIKVMRLNIGEQISLFNEENGEWLAKIIVIKKNSLVAAVLLLLAPSVKVPSATSIVVAPAALGVKLAV